MRVLLSIKPQYVDKILSGEKTFEFRKQSFKRTGINTVIIYATMPVGKVIGEFSILSILEDTPLNIWELTKKKAGIDKIFFDEYYKTKTKAVAIQIGRITQYDTPLELYELGENLIPPQSYKYLD